MFAVLFVAAIMGWGSAYWEKVRLQKDAHSIVHRVRVWFEAVSLDEKGKPFASHEEAINHVYGGDGGETLQLYRDLKSAEVYFSPSGQTGDPERN